MAHTFPVAPRAGTRRAVGALVIAGVAAAAACRGTSTPELEPDPARLLAGIVGTCAAAVRDVQIRRAGQGLWEPANAGAVLRAGDALRTGPRSTARVALLAGGGLELEESATVVVDVKPPDAAATRGARAPARAAPGESRIAVEEGVVRGVVPPADRAGDAVGVVVLSEGSEIRIASRPREEPARFRLARRELGTELALLHGAAAVRDARGETPLAAGQVAVVRGGELTDRAALIAPPEGVEPGMDARVQLLPGLALRLRWSEVPGATGYRIQLARDPSFRDVEVAEFTNGTDHVFVPPSAGAFVWRVAARDAAGRYGEYGGARRLHCEEQAPRDLLGRPADGAVVRPTGGAWHVTFSWEAAGEGRSYRVVLARGPDLLEPVASVVVAGKRGVLDVAEPGEYWWGVYTESEGDPRPLFTRPRRLSLQQAAEPRPQPRMEVPSAISQWGN